MFMEFLEKYIRGYNNIPKYIFIKRILTTLNNNKDNHKLIIKDMNREYLKNKIISYYNVIILVK